MGNRMFLISETVRLLFLGAMSLIGLVAAFSGAEAIPDALFGTGIVLFVVFVVSSHFIRGQDSQHDEQRGWHRAAATVAALGMLLITFNHPVLRDAFQPSWWMNLVAVSSVLFYLPFGIREFTRSLT